MTNSPAKQTVLKAIFGGTFDPPHLGHLQPLLTVLDALNMDSCELIPSHIPVHKTDCTSAIHRLRMTELLAQQDPRLSVNTIEIARDTPSYSAHTLTSLKLTHPDQAICFIMGLDAFLGLPSWFSPKSIMESCHLLVMMRSDTPEPSSPNASKESASIKNALVINNNALAALPNNAEQLIEFFKAQSATTIDSQDLPEVNPELRELLPKQIHLVSKITQNAHNLHINGILRASKQGEVVFVLNEQTNISSTAIRHAIEQGLSTEQWLTPEIEDYIQTHRIYQALR